MDDSAASTDAEAPGLKVSWREDVAMWQLQKRAQECSMQTFCSRDLAFLEMPVS